MSNNNNNKRSWDLYNDHVQCKESPERVDRQVHNTRTANFSLCNELNFPSPSTTYWHNRPEEIGLVSAPACLTDPFCSTSNTISSEVLLEQYSGDAAAAVYPATFAYSARQEQFRSPSGAFVSAYCSGYGAQIETRPTLAPHYQNENFFLSETLTYSSMNIQDPQACLLSASASSLVTSNWVSQNSSDSTLPTQAPQYQDQGILYEPSGNGQDYGGIFDESGSSSYPSSDMLGDFRQRMSQQDPCGFGSFHLTPDDTESSTPVDYLNTSSGPKELCSSQTALVSGFPEKPYDACFGMVGDKTRVEGKS